MKKNTHEKNPARAGRPKSEEKRIAILNAAGDLFLSRGLAGTSMDAVGEDAGVSKQTVYSHFSSKEDLFRTCIKNKVESYGFQEEDLPKDADLETVLKLLGKQFLNLIFDEGVVAMHRVVIGESASYPKIAELFYETGPQKTINAVAKYIDTQMTCKRLKPDNPYYIAVLFLGLVRADYQMQLLMGVQPGLADKDIELHLSKVVRQFMELYGTQ
ncbi:MAG: TetR/AcrR family transcriptional regulator [Gammaproteobacteria bacterium]|jgi:TetR/AcrR family transcriptional repressor of mexJK operon